MSATLTAVRTHVAGLADDTSLPIAVALERLGSPTVAVDPDGPLPDADGVTRAVVAGGHDTSADLRSGRADALIDWIAEVDGAGGAVLGIGTGAHLLAIALGGDSRAAAAPRRGWITVSSEEPDEIPAGPWLVWTNRRLELPRRARAVAHDRTGPQAFRAGPHLGVQFQPHATPQIVADWVRRSRDTLDRQGIHEATARDYPRSREAAQTLLTGFLDR